MRLEEIKNDVAEQFEKQLNNAYQSWLLGAGISFSANIPLMRPLTCRVLKAAKKRFDDDAVSQSVVDFLVSDCAEDAHIETYLTHLADIISMADRSKDNGFTIAKSVIEKPKLVDVHTILLELISDTVRWGYAPKNDQTEEQIGAPDNSIVKCDDHEAFIKAIFGSNRAGLESLRGPVEFFTTNYDTLIEDALALNRVPFEDGFVGGGVGYWDNYRTLAENKAKAIVTKLHGSIDWYRLSVSPSHLVRLRFGDTYPKKEGCAVIIHPQATKYMNAQLDPFAGLFSRFRSRLAHGKDHTLLICGYSFGDKHVNEDIVTALSDTASQLTLIAFAGLESGGKIPAALDAWRKKTFGDRVYIASPNGLYRGIEGPFFELDGGRDWWTFQGATALIRDGLPSDIQEQIQ